LNRTLERWEQGRSRRQLFCGTYSVMSRCSRTARVGFSAQFRIDQQIEKDLGIPATHVLLTATHTHSPGGQRGPEYAQKIVEAVRLAKQRLTPRRVGYGTGESYINVNRQIIDPKTGRWWEGPNREGPSRRSSSRSPELQIMLVACARFERHDRRPSNSAKSIRSGQAGAS
jgi:hypothetical protein